VPGEDALVIRSQSHITPKIVVFVYLVDVNLEAGVLNLGFIDHFAVHRRIARGK